MENEFMNQLIKLVKPELLILIPIAYLIGLAIKKSETIKDKYIPIILGSINVALCLIYTLATSEVASFQDVFAYIFLAVTQGILTSGCAVYVNQIIKQSRKEE